jgi:hypothetical protein
MLLKRDRANTASAEQALQRAVAVAHEQGSRSFGLRAALASAKLYQSTDRPADANAVLAPALKGFAPTPEMPEIAEAQALLEQSESGRERATCACAGSRRAGKRSLGLSPASTEPSSAKRWPPRSGLGLCPMAWCS